MDYNLLKTYSKVAELGSFTKAALELKQPKSRVSRAISRLEAELGVQLLRRTTRQTSLTTDGQQFFQKIKPLLNQLKEEINYLSSHQNEVTGVLRITAPEDMGETLVTEMISQFSKLYPKVEVQIIITNEFLDLTKQNIDLAFRVGKLNDSNLIQKKLANVQLILVASPQYLKNNGEPKELKNLEEHRFLSFKDFDKRVLVGKLPKGINLKPSLRSDSFSILLRTALCGGGITALPDFYCKKFIKNGELVKLFPKWNPDKDTIHMLYPPTKNLPLKVRKFIDIANQVDI